MALRDRFQMEKDNLQLYFNKFNRRISLLDDYYHECDPDIPYVKFSADMFVEDYEKNEDLLE